MNTIQTQEIPRIIKEHFPPDHLLSKIEVQQCYNKLQYDRSLQPHQKELIQERMLKIEQNGMEMEIQEAGETVLTVFRPLPNLGEGVGVLVNVKEVANNG